jgi:alpha-galactosidase
MTLIGFSQDGLEKFAGPGHWNDPDMLEIGNGGMKAAEYEFHMSLWAMLSAPLLAGNDLSKMSEETKQILMNKEAIAIDQDALGTQGKRIWVEGPLEIWSKELSGGKHALALFNRGESAMTFDSARQTLSAFQQLRFHEVWTKRDVTLNGESITIPSHAVMLLREF